MTAPAAKGTDLTALADEIETLEKAATAAPWKFKHRYGGYAPDGPKVGVDEQLGLGWDWNYDDANVPEEPMRGIFAKGADAGLVQTLRNSAPTITQALRALVQAKEALAFLDDFSWTSVLCDFPEAQQSALARINACRCALRAIDEGAASR